MTLREVSTSSNEKNQLYIKNRREHSNHFLSVYKDFVAILDIPCKNICIYTQRNKYKISILAMFVIVKWNKQKQHL